jgi:hypothetical protein
MHTCPLSPPHISSQTTSIRKFFLEINHGVDNYDHVLWPSNFSSPVSSSAMRCEPLFRILLHEVPENPLLEKWIHLPRVIRK